MPTVVTGEVAFQHTNSGMLFLTGNGLKIHQTDSLPPYDMQAGTVPERDGCLCGERRVTG
ncbi:hypothetical protein KPSB59_4090013 [Klebsiella quasipneumoniae subsp. quasipneumoniae]|nr:hypothetical protein KPSB59_4090013 [Klebsiella quasipneumoniae subsp. quasipneumoniae]